MANGFIPSDGRKELRMEGMRELAMRSFFQNTKEVIVEDIDRHEINCKTTCKMHDDPANSLVANISNISGYKDQDKF